MKLEDELKTTHFESKYHKAYLNLVFTASMLEHAMQQLLKGLDLTTPQLNVLRILRGQKGKPMSAFAIQERMVHRTSNVTRIIDKLVEKKLVSRTFCADNRRKVDIVATGTGLELLKKADKLVQEGYRPLQRAMTEQQAEDLSCRLEAIREAIGGIDVVAEE
ncbi:MAG: MarR family transcriptional regulator [Edaphocola sp.]